MVSKQPKAIWQRPSGIDARAAMFWAFLVLVCVTGGASRHDAMSLIVLRPLAILGCAYALIAARPGQLRPIAAPCGLLLALAGLMGLQLLPLPPALWEGLPGRDVIAEISRTLGLPPSWRPLTLTPARTWNSLFSLAVPTAALLLFAIQDESTRRKVPAGLLAVAGVSMVWGLFQTIGGENSVFYHYRVHTAERPIGMFANRNHQAMFLATGLFFAGMLALTAFEAKRSSTLRLLLLAGYAGLAVVFSFVLGSRGGLLLTVLAILAVAGILAGSSESLSGNRKKHLMVTAEGSFGARVMGRLRNRWALAGAGIAVLGSLGTLAIAMNRGEAFERLLSGGEAERFNRFETFPLVLRLLQDHFPWGSGFGSFDAVFRQVETNEMLSTFYFNQAHNDWLQIGVEGGLAAYLIAGGLVCWLGLSTVQLWRSEKTINRSEGLLLVCAAASIGVGSAFDYPLRTPLFMTCFALILAMIADRAMSHHSRWSGAD